MQPYNRDEIDPKRRLSTFLLVTANLLKKWHACPSQIGKFARAYKKGYKLYKEWITSEAISKVHAKGFDIIWFVHRAHLTGFFPSGIGTDQVFYANGHSVAFFHRREDGFDVTVSGKITSYTFDSKLAPTVTTVDNKDFWIQGSEEYKEEEYEEENNNNEQHNEG